MTKELVKIIKLRDRHEDLAFYWSEKGGEIVHAYMVPDGEDDVDWDFNIVSAEEAGRLIELYSIRECRIYG